MLPASLLYGMCRKTAHAGKPLHGDRMELKVCPRRVGIDEGLGTHAHVFDVVFHHDESPQSAQSSTEM